MLAHYNLLYREEEREPLPFCIDQSIAVLPWSLLERAYRPRPLTDLPKTAGNQTVLEPVVTGGTAAEAPPGSAGLRAAEGRR